MQIKPRSSDVHIEPAIADYIMDLIGVVLYAGAFIIYIITDEKFKKKGRVKRRSDERDGKIEISVERFKTLVEALEALPDCTHLSGGLLSRHELTRLRGFYRTPWKS
jgi:hypothetical protein